MAFLFVNIKSGTDKEASAIEIGRFFDIKADQKIFLLLHEPVGTGELLGLIETLGFTDFELEYVNFPISELDADLFSFFLNEDDSGGRYLLDTNTQVKSIERNFFTAAFLGMLVEIKNAAIIKMDPAVLAVKVNAFLGYLSIVEDSPLISEMKKLLIAVEHVFKFEELRTCWGGCGAEDELIGISRSIQNAMSFSKTLESGGSFVFREIFRCAEHLQNGKILYARQRPQPFSPNELIYYRKLQVWVASLHLSLAMSISHRVRHSNDAIHHCVRCIEAYLSGYLVAAKILIANKNNVLRDAQSGEKINGVGMLLKHCPSTVPPEIEKIIKHRNSSELAHGSKRWSPLIAQNAVSAVNNFIGTIDNKYGDKEFSEHFKKACSVDLVQILRGMLDQISEKARQHLIA